jgi:mxaC protein
MFDKTPDSGSRAIVLLSDGAGNLTTHVQQKVRDWCDRMHVTLYWIVLRQPGGLSIFDEKSLKDTDSIPPEVKLHEYFKTFRTEYHPYEADDPQSLALAIEDINRKEKKPIRYLEQIPGRDFTSHCFVIAVLMIGMLLGIKMLEVRSWH